MLRTFIVATKRREEGVRGRRESETAGETSPESFPDAAFSAQSQTTRGIARHRRVADASCGSEFNQYNLSDTLVFGRTISENAQGNFPGKSPKFTASYTGEATDLPLSLCAGR